MKDFSNDVNRNSLPKSRATTDQSRKMGYWTRGLNSRPLGACWCISKKKIRTFKHLGGSKKTPIATSYRPLKCIGCYNDANLCIVITFLHVVFNAFQIKFIYISFRSHFMVSRCIFQGQNYCQILFYFNWVKIRHGLSVIRVKNMILI